MAVMVLDAGVVIAVIERSDVHHDAAHRALDRARTSGARMILPAAAYAEVLVKPFGRSTDAAAQVDDFVDSLPAVVEPITRPIAAEAARLRARHGRALRLPDALIIATAISLRADLVLTTDGGWPDVGIPVELVRA